MSEATSCLSVLRLLRLRCSFGINCVVAVPTSLLSVWTTTRGWKLSKE